MIELDARNLGRCNLALRQGIYINEFEETWEGSHRHEEEAFMKKTVFEVIREHHNLTHRSKSKDGGWLQCY